MSAYGSHFALPVIFCGCVRIGWLIANPNAEEMAIAVFAVVITTASWRWFEITHH